MQPARPPPPLIWITRAEPGASATAGRVAALGLDPLIAPLLGVRPLPGPLDLAGVGALAFTSGNAVSAFAARSDRRDLRVFAVGDATAEAARTAGFTHIASADGDVAALAALIVEARPAGSVLQPGAREPAGDLIGALARAGLTARAAAVYETVAAAALPPAAAEALTTRRIAAVLVHSPRAGAALAALAPGTDLPRAVVVGLSANCLHPLRGRGFAASALADHPREEALLAALSAALGKARPPR